MIRPLRNGLALIAAGLCMAGVVALAEESKQDAPDASAKVARREAARADLSGNWRLDASKSDMPRRGGGRGMGMGRGSGGWGGGSRGGMGGEGGPPPGGPPPEGGFREGRGERGPRPGRLPDFIHVTETHSIVSVEDSAGAVVREITTVAGTDEQAHAPGADVAAGVWKGDKLEIEREGMQGTKVVETITLEDKGRELVFRTKISGGDRPGREFKRVYRRVTSS